MPKWPGKRALSGRPALALEGKGGNHLRYSPLPFPNHLLGYLFGTLGPPWEAMSDRETKKASGIIFQDAKMCPKPVTVFKIHMWPNLGSRSQTAPDAVLEGTFLI